MTVHDLNAMVGSRICHDLISPLGAIGNGLELLAMSGQADAPEMALISESVENANARIRFFRIAFGAANTTSMIGDNELRSVLADQYRGNRLKVDWRIGRDVRRAEAKLAFLLLQCLETAMPWGGRVQVTLTDDTWNIFGTGERIKCDTNLWGFLTGRNGDLDVTASNVHFALAPEAAHLLGRTITANFTETSLSVSF